MTAVRSLTAPLLAALLACACSATAPQASPEDSLEAGAARQRQLYGKADSASAEPSGGWADGAQLVVAVDAANLRSRGTLGAGIQAVLGFGSFVRVTGERVAADGYTWYPVKTDEGRGWMAGVLLQPASTRELAAWTPGTEVAVAVSDGVNVREQAGTDATIVGAVPYGTILTIEGEGTETGGYTWFPVTADGLRGWVASLHLVPPDALDDVGEDEGGGNFGGWGSWDGQCRTYSDAEIAHILRTTGFPEWTIPDMIRIAHCESTNYNCATNWHNWEGKTDWGILQVNEVWLAGTNWYDQYNPWKNAARALHVFHQQGMRAWVCYCPDRWPYC